MDRANRIEHATVALRRAQGTRARIWMNSRSAGAAFVYEVVAPPDGTDATGVHVCAPGRFVEARTSYVRFDTEAQRIATAPPIRCSCVMR
jgi:hypothetical protein